MAETAQQQKLEDMHPIIQWSLDGGESTFELGRRVRRQHPTERTALEIETHVEKEPLRVRFDIRFMIESQGTASYAGMVFKKMPGPKYNDVVEDAKRLARDLRTTYNLDYTPNIYFAGKIV